MYGFYDELATVVIDNGSGMIKAGFNFDPSPISVFPSIVGRPKFMQTVAGGRNRDRYVGDEACAKAFLLLLKSPIEHGIVTNWDDMEKILHHTLYNGLRIDPAEHPVLMTEVPMNPKSNREKMAQIMFETFNIPSFYVDIPASLSLFSSGRTTGIVLDCGDDVTYVVPIYEGATLADGIKRMNFGGRDLTQWMRKLLLGAGYIFTTSAEIETIVRDIKEKKSYVALDFEEEIHYSRISEEPFMTQYEDFGGQILKFGEERFMCPELLFKPFLTSTVQTIQYKVDCPNVCGVHELFYDSIMTFDFDVRWKLYSNVFLSGGSTMFQGFKERFEKEIKAFVSDNWNVRVHSLPNPQYEAWIGGAYLSSLCTFPQMVITHEEYNESGPSIAHRKCFSMRPL